jgi:hypothetical protein
MDLVLAQAKIGASPEDASAVAQRLKHACLEVEDSLSKLNVIASTIRSAGACY